MVSQVPSLPPLVEGELRCFLALKVGVLSWTISTAPKDVQVGITWWGQKEKPVLLRPFISIDPNFKGSSKSSEIDFPVRCGPKQFSAYLKDMGQLHLDVVYGPSLTKFAKVEIKDLHKLTASCPITSCYPMTCTAAQFRNKMVGRLDVSLIFKTISDVFASSTSTPVRSLTSKETSTPVSSSKERPNKNKHIKSKKNSKERKKVQISRNSPDRILYHVSSPLSRNDNDISFIVGPGAKVLKDNEKRNGSESVPVIDDLKTDILPRKDMTKLSISPRRMGVSDSLAKKQNMEECSNKAPISLTNENSGFVLSSLLSRGQQLRNEMLKSTIHSQQERLTEIHRSDDVSSGSLIQELLDDAEVMESVEVNRYGSENKNIELKAVDLVLGKEDNLKSMLTKFEVSDDSDEDYSDEQDPLHDSSLLTELFYTTKKPNPDESSILFSDSDDDKNMKSCDKIKKKVKQRSIQKDTPEKIEDGKNGGPLNSEPSSTDISVTSLSGDDTVPTDFPDDLSDHISIQKLTELARIKSIKLTFKELHLSNMNAAVYFIEICFPIDEVSCKEVIRVVSRNVNEKYVDFNRVSVFPVHFNENMINFWWGNDIKLMILAKFTNDSKPVVIGFGFLKLQKVIINENFTNEYKVQILKSRSPEDHGETEGDVLGHLEISMELIGDHKPLASHKQFKVSQTKKQSVSELVTEANRNIKEKKVLTPVTIKTKVHTNSHASKTLINNALEKNLNSKDTSLDNTLLQNVIFIDEGKDIVYNRESCQNCNLYFVCRVFWSKEELKSKICWDSIHPNFQYQQITAVSMTSDSINKMKNNYMIIEVWHKSTTTQSDKLIGMSKVSLHQFYLSYRDSQIADTIMKSKYPAISCDGWIPVINLLSASEHGSLKVLFALGTHDQIFELLQVRGAKKPVRAQKNVKLGFSCRDYEELQSEHVVHDVEITIQSMKGMLEINQEIWGETDCFIQYHFPIQKKGDVKLCKFQSKPTLCVPNPMFNHTTIHKFTLHRSSSLQKILLHGFNKSHTPTEVIFELWKRLYYPNIRDQLVAKASLAMPKLCALITMYDKSDVSSQTFHVPFITNDSQDSKAICSTLSLLVKYQSTNHFQENALETQKVICLRVSILKLCGLKTCAMKLVKENPELEQYLSKGLNLFVRFYLSFTEEYANRTTQVASQSFSPTFNYHAEFALPLFKEDSDGKPRACLARLLENGYLICDVLHEYDVEDKDDVCIGRMEIPLFYILSRSTGIKGWWPLYLPKRSRSTKKDIEQVAGGIDLEVNFLHSSARDLIINNGMGESWTPPQLIQLNDEAWLSSADVFHDNCYLYIIVDQLWLPNSVVKDLLPLAKHRRNIYVYSRYKFYDKSPVCSHLMKLIRREDGRFDCSLEHSKSFRVAPTTSFAWYLREESFEIQFWLSMASDSSKRKESNHRTYDKLIGSCYIDWSVFSRSPFQKHSFSGLYNFFKAGSADICGAKARLAFSMNERCVEVVDPERYDTSLEYPTDDQSINEENSLVADICTQARDADTKIPKKVSSPLSVDDPQQMPIHFHIEEALHLPLYLRGDSYCQPDIYVSYQLADTHPVVHTNVCHQTTKPKFDFQKVESLNPEVLRYKNLAFKVWRCVKEVQELNRDILLGIAHVDPEPLFVGMKQVSGWYNIQDFNRKIIGQLKVGIIPSVTLSPSRSSKFFKNFELTAPVNFDIGLFSKHPETDLNMHDTCKAVLFEQLRRQLNDLSEMTKQIKNRVDPVCPISLTRELPHYQGTAAVENEPKKQSQGLSNELLTSVQMESEVTPYATADRSLSLSESIVEINSTEEDCASELKTGKEGVFNSKDDLPNSLESGDEQTYSDVDNQSLTGSTDELMEHLKRFEIKYKHLKDIAQSDDVDFSRVLPQVGITVENLNNQTTSDTNTCHDDIIIQSKEPMKANMISTDYTPALIEPESIFLERYSSSEHSADIIEPDNLVLPNTRNGENREDSTTSTRKGNIDASNSVKINDNNPTLEPTITSSLHRNIEATTLPNFFMRPKEMAESIKALRIAANFRRSPRPLQTETDEYFVPPTWSTPGPTESDKILMERIKTKIPVEPSEMARIASIFSSNPNT